MSEQLGFGDRLAAAMTAHGPICVGIDPHPHLLRSWGLPVSAHGVRSFGLTVVEALGGQVAAFKPQSAFFEEYGSAGVAALEEVIAACREAGSLCIVDAKRGDIGSTMEGYARAYLTEGSPLAGDAVTLSPYLGVGALEPAFEAALENHRGVFVLALTSNPQGASVQHARQSDGTAVARKVVEELTTWNEKCSAEHIFPFGLVVGATVGDALRMLQIDLSGFSGAILSPGVGAQGAGSSQLTAVFGNARSRVLASTSRAILASGPDQAGLRTALKEAWNSLSE
ncbi:MAG: orotidine-5'-phosphate decarboxylase [Actinomycetaceae bacterium]|nr:orotidine-5'-phosphate decarboxylase [Actinomycetaceae bacterium]